ncbi:MAG: diguanylate cyclase [Deltaproteobacteria bacterium]|nr:diguanylate cyclase [Deltaproteobacteria bacterium]
MATMLESPASVLSGLAELPGLEILGLIGEGASSFVYRARRGREDVALKIQKAAAPTPEMRRRAWREAATLARLRHPSLCAIRTVDELNGRIYIVMEYVEGETLGALLARKSLTDAEVRSMGTEIADALGVVHRGGLVHGDIKPGNILIDHEGRPKIIDFGLSVRTQGGEETESAFGTLTHASPEQLRVLKRPVDARSDLYSLGVLLYEMAVGHLPFQSDAADDLLRMHATMIPTAPNHLRASVSETLSQTIMRLLAKDPDDRYQSSAELVHDLARDAGSAFDLTPRGGVRRPRHHGTTGSGDLPLAGRRVQVHRLLEAWDFAREGRGSAVLVAGPAGCGKSRLAREVMRGAETEGACVLTAKCTALDPLPFAGARQLLSDLLGQVWALGVEGGADGLRARVIAAVGLGGVYLRRLVPEFARILPGIRADLDEIQTSEQMNASLVQLFSGLARDLRALVLVVDDAQWLDDATLGVLARLDSEIPTARLLLLGTARTGGDSEAGIQKFRASVPKSLALEMQVGHLDSESTHHLIKSYLSTQEITSDIVDRLRVRSEGNALAILEYLQALVDTGCIRYSWGRWVLTDTGLEQIELPDHIMNVVTDRLLGFGRDVLSILAVAAMLGSRFSLDTLRLIVTPGDLDVDGGLQAALSGGVIERLSGLRYAFVHDRLREAVLSTLTVAERIALHRAIALCLDSAGSSPNVASRDEWVYDVAHHFTLAQSSDLADRAFLANWRAAKAAQRSYAFDQAYAFFASAESMAELAAGKLEVPAEYFFDRGLLCVAAWKSEEAAQCFERVLASTRDADLRARTSMELAKLRIKDTALSKQHAADALAALGEPYIDPTVARAARTLLVWLLRVVFPLPPIERHDSPAMARTEMLVECHEHAGFIEFYQSHPLGMLQAPFASYRFARRLGPSRAQVGLFGATASMAAVFGLRRVAHRFLGRARAVANELGDPATMGRANLFAGYVLEYEGKPALAAEAHQQTLNTYRKWMEAYYSESCLGTLIPNLMMRGLFSEALGLVERAVAERGMPRQSDEKRVSRVEARPSDLLLDVMTLAGQAALDLRGRFSIEEVEGAWRRYTAAGPFFNGLFVGLVAMHRLYSGAAPETIDRLLAAFLAERPKLRAVHQLHVFPVAELWIRLQQMESAATPDARRQSRTQYRAALARLKLGARHPTIRAHVAAGEAKRLYLDGNVRRCVRRMTEAQALAEAQDNPWVLFEMALLRAQIRRAVGPSAAATRLEAIARDFAVAHRVAAWERRSGVSKARPSVSATRPPQSEVRTASVASASELQTSRSLSALLQVSLASTMILDPARQARVVLDKIVQLLGAERALLFLVDESSDRNHANGGSDGRGGSDVSNAGDGSDASSAGDGSDASDAGGGRNASDAGDGRNASGGNDAKDESEEAVEIRFSAGRTNQGTDVVMGSAYSRSVLSDVVRTRQAVVIGGIDGRVRDVSESVVLHDLRSVVAAPLMLRDRLMGVVYADNTLARGMFTEDDVGVFSAIANHVAIAIETARTARLEAEVEAERAQRKLAEHLGAVISSLGSSLELREVLESILDNMTHVVSYRRAVLFLTRGATLSIASHRGFAAESIDPGREVGFEECEESGDLERNQKPSVLRKRFPYPYAGLIDHGDVVLSIPLVVRDEVLGLLTLQVDDPGHADSNRISMASMFAGHAAIAVENARLFEEVRAQATTDSLTGLLTRRHFFLLADREFAVARREARRLSVLMSDVDHFKRINDTYGHAVGDEVLVETARRLRAEIRETDILGRFGGEEFCLVLVEGGTSWDATAGRVDLVIAERLRRAIADRPFETSRGAISVTVSIGLAAHGPEDFESSVPGARGTADVAAPKDARRLLERADEALYRAKRSGRNRVEVFGREPDQAR